MALTPRNIVDASEAWVSIWIVLFYHLAEICIIECAVFANWAKIILQICGGIDWASGCGVTLSHLSCDAQTTATGCDSVWRRGKLLRASSGEMTKVTCFWATGKSLWKYSNCREFLGRIQSSCTSASRLVSTDCDFGGFERPDEEHVTVILTNSP